MPPAARGLTIAIMVSWYDCGTPRAISICFEEFQTARIFKQWRIQDFSKGGWQVKQRASSIAQGRQNIQGGKDLASH